jgi:hypothetical protein
MVGETFEGLRRPVTRVDRSSGDSCSRGRCGRTDRGLPAVSLDADLSLEEVDRGAGAEEWREDHAAELWKIAHQ